MSLAASDAVPNTTQQLIAALEAQIESEHSRPHLKRDAHPKMHGCVQGELIVEDKVPRDLQHGVFAREGHAYPVWVRFSNSFRFKHDYENDTRGMAIKLLCVDGERLDGDERDTQDFVFATHDAFFLPDSTHYVAFIEATKTAPWGVMWFYLRRPGLWRAALALLKSQTVLAWNPLALTYSSQTPFHVGPTIVKLEMRATTAALRLSPFGRLRFRLKRLGWRLQGRLTRFHVPPPTVPRDVLRHAMAAHLASHDATFDLVLQRFSNERKTPTGDASRRWRVPVEREAKVATLRIPRQVFWPEPGMPKAFIDATTEMMRLGETMSFNPWHGLQAHAPVGEINETRRHVYPAIVAFRRSGNQVSAPGVIGQQTEAYDRLRPIVQFGKLELT